MFDLEAKETYNVLDRDVYKTDSSKLEVKIHHRGGTDIPPLDCIEIIREIR